MPVTQAQIAKECNVSQQTVSYILSQKKAHLYSKELQKKVLSKAVELGYKKNLAALAIAKGKFNCIGILTSEVIVRSVIRLPFLWSVENTLIDNDMTLMISHLPESSQKLMSTMPRTLSCATVDGYLIYYTHRMPKDIIKLLNSLPTPSVWINTKREFNAVFPDDYTAGFDLTSKLISMGHKKIVYVDCFIDFKYNSDHYSVKDRFEGYSSAMNLAGLSAESVFSDKPYSTESLEKKLRYILSGTKKPTAIVTNWNPYFLFLLCCELGLSVPNDISIAAFSNDEIILPGNVSLTVMMVDDLRLGYESTNMLLRLINSPGINVNSIKVPHIFKEGNSISIPPKICKIKEKTIRRSL